MDIINGFIFLIIILSLVHHFIEWYYNNNNTNLFKVLFYSIYLIEYCLVIAISYFVTDTITEFLLVTICLFIIHFMFMTINRSWLKSKFHIRLLIVFFVPIISIFIISYISQFILFDNTFFIIMVVGLMSNTKQKDTSKRKYFEATVLVISFILCFVLFEQGYLGEFYNKPQVYAINKMINELDIKYDDIVRIGKEGGVRGELIKITFETRTNYYKVYYKDEKILKYD